MSGLVQRQEAAERRILFALARGPMSPEALTPGSIRLSAGDRNIKVPLQAVSALARSGLIARNADRIELTRDGVSRARRLKSVVEPFREQHAPVETIPIADQDGWTLVHLNTAESPLAQLVRRKDADGAAFLTEAEFDAGEKLRADYTMGQIMPRVGANWEAPISRSRRGAPACADLALPARRAGVGPERPGAGGAPAGGTGDRGRRAGIVGRPDRRMLLSQGARASRTRTALAGALGETDPQVGAGAAGPAL